MLGHSIFPENHILNNDFTIPPGLSVRKWVVLSSQNHDKIGFITKFDIEYETVAGTREQVRIILDERDFKLHSKKRATPVWQEMYYKEIKGMIQ